MLSRTILHQRLAAALARRQAPYAPYLDALMGVYDGAVRQMISAEMDNAVGLPVEVETPAEVRTEFLFPDHSMARLREKIEKIAKRAKKIGVPPITMEIIETFETPDKDGWGYHRFHRVKIEGQEPIIRGWRVKAALDHTALSTGALIKTLGRGGRGLEDYRHRGPTCDHCRVNRMRSKTYILENIATGEQKQVGRSCLKDFTGHGNPEQIARFFESIPELIKDLHEIEEFGDELPYHRVRIPTDDVLATFAKVIEEDGGYVSRWKAETEGYKPTVQTVRELFAKPGRWMEQKPTRRHYQAAKDIKAQVMQVDEPRLRELFSFEAKSQDAADEEMAKIRNMQSIVMENTLDPDILGFAGAIFPIMGSIESRMKRMDRIKHKRNVGGFVGVVGQYLTLPVTLKHRYSRDTSFLRGRRYVNVTFYGFIFEDDGGNTLTWETSSPPLLDGVCEPGIARPVQTGLTTGQRYIIRGKVKEHWDSPKYGPQTKLTRAGVLDIWPDLSKLDGEDREHLRECQMMQVDYVRWLSVPAALAFAQDLRRWLSASDKNADTEDLDKLIKKYKRKRKKSADLALNRRFRDWIIAQGLPEVVWGMRGYQGRFGESYDDWLSETPLWDRYAQRVDLLDGQT